MTLLYEEKKDLIKYRIQNADDILEEAEILFEKGKIKEILNIYLKEK